MKAAATPPWRTVHLPVTGMDCQDEANAIETAVGKLAGVHEVRVTVSGARATVTYDPALLPPDAIHRAIASTGCRVVDGSVASMSTAVPSIALAKPAAREAGQLIGWAVLGSVAAVVVLAAVGERLGVLGATFDLLPWWLAALAILLGGWRVFLNVARAAWRRQVTSHTLMTAGVIAAAGIGQWSTAALIVFFMRFADWLEDLTNERSREALNQLIALQPTTARVLRGGVEVEVAVGEVAVGEIAVVRPGEQIPVDGEVTEGQAPVDQASITGESVPVDKAPGDPVFATTVAAGFLKVRAGKVGADTTFARIVRLVEEAESRKAPVQRFADRFATFYLPTVLVIAAATYLLTGQILNAVATVVVACACAITLATPVVVLASVGNAAKRGLLIKGGIALEQLARIDTVVMDKTGTLTFGEPRLSDVIALDGSSETDLLRAVATAESRSEHPLARAIVRAAAARGISVPEPRAFAPLPGRGVVATISGAEWAVGNRRLLTERGVTVNERADRVAEPLERAGRTAFFVAQGAEVVGVIGLADTVRPEVRAALEALTRLGVKRQLLLTGDNARVAAAIAGELGLEYRAELLPEDKIAAVRELQAAGAVVLMIGDGVNDAPALAQANIGMAMGGAGTDVAIEAADVALMRDDWAMVPEAVIVGRRAARTIRQNLAFAAVYNVVGISLAFLGLLPPVWAAAAQSLPDVAIMLNSALLLRSAPEPEPLRAPSSASIG